MVIFFILEVPDYESAMFIKVRVSFWTDECEFIQRQTIYIYINKYINIADS